MPAEYEDLRIVMKHGPRIFVLIRGTGVCEQVEETVIAFNNLCHLDPLNDFFVDPVSPHINHKGIKNNTLLPKFQRTAQYLFETWAEHERVNGIGALSKLRFGSRKIIHTGQGAFVPLSRTYNNQYKIYLAYNVQFSPSDEDDNPALTKGDFVKVEFFPGTEVASAHQ
jgi:hypothetical protein